MSRDVYAGEGLGREREREEDVCAGKAPRKIPVHVYNLDRKCVVDWFLFMDFF